MKLNFSVDIFKKILEKNGIELSGEVLSMEEERNKDINRID